ncbi:MAG: ATP-binding protein [Nostocaceae cyanobacterium]|nr:ATP-binding protein [Nostocaceae cyanobacterium]
MKKFPIALRISIPVILLIFGSVLGGFSFYRDVSLSFARTEKNANAQARFSGDQISGMLEYFFRKNDVEGAELVISKLGGNPALKLAILSNENNKILLATRYELRNRKLIDTEAEKYLSDLERVRENMSSKVKMNENKDVIQAIYPVVLGSVPGEVRPSKVGVLLLQYDVSELKQTANADALQRSLEATVVLTFSCLLVWIFFDRTLTNRAVLLVKATNSLAQGNLDKRSGLQGSDELAQISVAFDRMADKIQLNQYQLKKIAERSELLNYLASQIRNSLELEQVLGTAVEEIRNLFQIERCKFLWCSISEDKAPQFELCYEASISDQSHSISHNDTIWQMQTLGQHLQNLELLRIDDVSVDSQLDHKSQGLLTYLGISSLLIAFLRTRSGQIGVIVCEHCKEPRPWDDDEVELLQSVTNQLAIAIDQAELYSQSRNTAVVASTQANKLSTALKELQQTQAQLIQTEKMSSLGQMVAGVAHEINNPVNFIYANLGHANNYFEDLVALILLYQQHYPHPKSDIIEMMEEIDFNYLVEDLPRLLSSMEMGADRIREIVLTLRNFSRLDEAEMKPVNIHEGIDSTLVILHNRIKANREHPAIEIIKEYGELPKVECYAGQLNQVFMNIITNAIDALREYNKTRSWDEISAIPMKITISTQILEANWVSICIKDNGSGIPEKVRDKIFDPFFTTKPVGEGTGLGLSISYQIIVDKHGGHLKCMSEPGKGTEFWIQIPVGHHTLTQTPILTTSIY